jgi:DNA-binding IclR family transcriptional regulator
MTGLTLRALVELTGHDRRRLRAALHAEIERGRVTRDPDGHYRLIPEAFARETLRALREIDNDAADEAAERSSP